MTREELLGGYLEETLDDEATAELEKRLSDDPDFAARFAQDLLDTGLFVQVDNELQRIEPMAEVQGEGRTDQQSGGEEEEGGNGPRGGRPKLLLGSEVEGDLPPSLQRIVRPDPEPERAVPAAPLSLSRSEGDPSESSRAESPPHPPPPPPPPGGAAPAPPSPPRPTSPPDPSAPPRASLLPPPASPPTAARYDSLAPPAPSYDALAPAGGALGVSHGQPVLRSSRQRSPVVAMTFAALLLVGIGVALLLGLNREPPAPPETAGIIAKMDAVEGSVLLTRGIGQEKATVGMDFFEGDLVEVEAGAARIAFVSEATYLHLRSGSEIRFEEQQTGKRVRLALGEMTVESAPQPVGKPMVITTSHAQTVPIGGKVAFTVRAIAKETLVEVSRGSVRVERPGNEAWVELESGSWTLAGEDRPLIAWEFVAGVNLSGEAVEIDGRNWLSHAEAQSQGMKVEALGKDPELRKSLQQPGGYVPGKGVRQILMTSVGAQATRLSIKWPQPDGAYQVFVWMMEDAGNRVRSLRLNLEDALVAEGLGKDQILGGWNGFGPYPANVEDGSLDLLLSADRKFENHDPQVAGFAIYGVAGASPANPNPPVAPASVAVPALPDTPEVPPAIQPTVP